MKRILASILLIIYAVTSSGTSIHVHYCMGKLADWSLWSDSREKTCRKCGMEQQENVDNGCCHDVNSWVKIQDDQKASFALFQLFKISPDQHNYIAAENNQAALTENLRFHPESHAPPRSWDVAIYKRNRVFRI